MSTRNEQQIRHVFAGRAASLRLFRLVASFVRSLGPVEVVPRKTQVGFRRKRTFAWVWLPQTWIKKQPGDSITLTFSLRRRVKHPRIKESLEPYPGRFTHHVVILNASEFDAPIKQWLRQAYDLAG